MPSSRNTTRLSHIDCPGGGQVWVEGTTLFVGHMRSPSGTSIYDVADPRRPRLIARIDLPEGWHSHKVRVADDIMVVNHEKLGQSGPAGFRRRPRHLRRVAPARAEADHQMDDLRRPRRAPLRFRRPLRLYLADRRGLCRQYRHDPRPRRPGPSGRGRPLVDPRPMGRRRRGLSARRRACRRAATIRCAWATGSMSATGSTGSTSSTSRTCRRPTVVSHMNSSPAFPHPTHTCLPMPRPLEGPRHHGGGRRGRGETLSVAAGLRLDLRHHQRDGARCRSRPIQVEGLDPRRRAATRR